jgi:hypothetical protein
MLTIIIQKCNLNLHIFAPTAHANLTAPEDVLSTDALRLTAIEPVCGDIPGASRLTPAGSGVSREPESRTFSGASIAVSERGASLRTGAVGEIEQSAFTSQIRASLGVIHKSVEDAFPANKITAKCFGCGEVIPRFRGYHHILIGEKKMYCAKCHEAMGLPLRSEVDNI